ncbi:MAG: hypothetical protein ABW252_21650 [Polyangiales bacterium]
MKPEPTLWDTRLDEAKRAYRAEGPSEAQLARMLHAIEGAPASTATGATVGAKIAKVTLLALAVVAASIALTWPEAPEPSAPPVTPRIEAPAAPAATPFVPEPAPIAPSVEAPPTPQPAVPAPKKGERGQRSRAPDLMSELALLQRARRIVLRDPARALAITEEHARDYPRGVFMEERELLAVQALLGTNRRAAAERRAQQFRKTHPSSVHAHRMNVMLDGSKD